MGWHPQAAIRSLGLVRTQRSSSVMYSGGDLSTKLMMGYRVWDRLCWGLMNAYDGVSFEATGILPTPAGPCYVHNYILLSFFVANQDLGGVPLSSRGRRGRTRSRFWPRPWGRRTPAMALSAQAALVGTYRRERAWGRRKWHRHSRCIPFINTHGFCSVPKTHKIPCLNTQAQTIHMAYGRVP